jgi:hypothetical protein
MKVTRIFAALLMVAGFAGAAHAQGCARLSWGTCDPWVENQNFGAAVPYVLVESALGVGEQNVGTDSNIHIGAFSGPVPDAWRFDDTGCQTGSQLGLATKALSKACPVMLGPSSLAITNYFVPSGGGEADLRLSVTYDTFTPSAATRYTLWLVTFDHTFSSVGPTPPDLSSCGGAELCENLNLSFCMYLNLQNQLINLGSCDTDASYPPGAFVSGFATWNGGCHPVATQAKTWGALKGLYH